MPIHHLCVGAILVEGDQLLLGCRSANRVFYPDVWDVFGGHVEQGEKAEETLVREVKEELGVCPTEWTYIETMTTVSGENTVECHYYAVTAWHGTPTNRQPEEHALIQWFPLQSALMLDFADPGYPALFDRVVKSLRTGVAKSVLRRLPF